jgi:hypothetical protein
LPAAEKKPPTRLRRWPPHLIAPIRTNSDP